MEDREERMDELIDSLGRCFDANGDFAAHPFDESRAAQAYTTAVGALGLDPEHFIDLLIGKSKSMYTDKKIIDNAEESIREFVRNQLDD